ncbi:MAG: hypothetical protein HY308_09015 [Gammaproteobacteria bacterium]|nr:hypothetical protein [Gammaproteobacteria bacterium]
MNHFSLRKLTIGIAFSFFSGFGLALLILHHPAHECSVTTDSNRGDVTDDRAAGAASNDTSVLGKISQILPFDSTAAGSVSSAEVPASLDQLWATLMASSADGQTLDREVVDRLRELVRTDSALLHELLGRYDQSDEQAKRALQLVLSDIQLPEVVAFSARLATQGDASQRLRGWELLGSLGADTTQVRELVKQTLATETNPDVLSRAIAVLRPTVVEQTEAQSMAAKFTDLARHNDPVVRSESLRALAIWDKTGNAAEAGLYQGLLDQSLEVRRVALSVVGDTPLRSERLKTALMDMIQNAHETPDIQAAALEALQHFALNSNEYARYNEASVEVERYMKAIAQNVDGNGDEENL